MMMAVTRRIDSHSIASVPDRQRRRPTIVTFVTRPGDNAVNSWWTTEQILGIAEKVRWISLGI
jgi:hypothetical protein